MTFDHAPTGAASPGPPLPSDQIDPATAVRFRLLEENGAQARLDNLRTDPPMVPTLALEQVAATLHPDGYRQVAISPRRGTPFMIVLHRYRNGVVGQQPQE